MRNGLARTLLGCGLLAVGAANLLADEPRFERTVIDDDFPGAYQVEVSDVNGDGKPDLIAVGGGTCAWYENPSWTKRIISGPKQTPGIISSATRDLDGDGKAEVAIAFEFSMNEPRKGKLTLAVPGNTSDEPWTLQPIGEIPSIHRLRWGDVDGDGQPELVVAPIFGVDATAPKFDQDAPMVYVIQIRSENGRFRAQADRPEEPFLPPSPVLHAIDVLDFDGDGRSEILRADNAGVTRLSPSRGSAGGWSAQVLAQGAPGASPNRGASEVHLGRLADDRRLLATIEPWHGNVVAVYTGKTPGSFEFGPRTVIDDTLDAGHALWLADVDGDGADEVFAGHRGKDHRVSIYDFDGKTWNRTVLDRDIAAQDLRGGDLDGDGAPDVVAVGGSTRNVVWYRPVRSSKP